MSYTTQQFSAGNPPLHHLFHEIDTGKLELPDLQRPLVWKRSRIRIVELEMFDRNKPKNILIKNVFIWAVSLLMIASTTYAKQCSEPYNKNSLPIRLDKRFVPMGSSSSIFLLEKDMHAKRDMSTTLCQPNYFTVMDYVVVI